MSHLKERSEKNCLNCNAEVYGRYCHICGQENIEPRETFWSLATHFVYDIVHFDGKFFSTLHHLLLKPGFLSKEFVKGRRASYLHPIKMYVFTSAIFFILFFSFIIHTDEIGTGNKFLSNAEINNQIAVMKDSLAKITDTAQRRKVEDVITGLNYFAKLGINTGEDSVTIHKFQTDSALKFNNGKSNIIGDSMPATITEYDSLQKTLPPDKKDGWFIRAAKHRMIQVNQKYKGKSDEFKSEMIEKFKHSVPQMMFISLPLVALVLQLLYIRNMKQLFYTDHVILIIHVYIAIFISLLLYYAFSGLYNATNFKIFEWLTTIIGIYIFLYCFVAMYKFYKQGIFKTFIKYFILLFVAAFLTGILTTLFIITSFFQI